MGRKRTNPAWDNWLGEIRTDHELLRRALQSRTDFDSFLARYRRYVLAYLKGYLTRHEQVADADAADEAARLIWRELKRAFPAYLSDEWKKGTNTFRDILYDGVHEAYGTWFRPATRALISPGAADAKAWNAELRRACIRNALAKLKDYQAAHRAEQNRSYDLFRLWDKHANRKDKRQNKKLAELAAMFAAMPGGQQLKPVTFRKALGKAKDRFGRFLHEEVGVLVFKGEVASPEEYIRAFEELHLLREYALKSKACRLLLGLGGQEDEDE